MNVGGDAGVSYEPGWVASDDSNIAPTTANLATFSYSTCLGIGSPPFSNAYDTWTSTAGTQENLPINCVNWYEAYAFCIWDGGFLPSEAEWGYAAAGGNQQREYPWGSTPPGTSNQYAIYGDSNGNCYYPSGMMAACTGVANIAPVGTAKLGAGLWGQLDLAGNVFGWTLDGYATYADPCTDCADLTSTAGRAFRGGWFYDGALYLVPSYRGTSPPTFRSGSLGFRCSRSP
jgi:formylglycine-generating enzyme required for sulfatase activity